MEKVKRFISLDFQRKNNVHMVYATQCDMNYRVIVINLYNDGKVFPINAYSGAVAAINVLRPDGKSSSFPATISGIGQITYELTSWPVGIAGDVKMSVALYGANGGRISTDPFTVHVSEGLYLGSEVEEDTENQTAFSNMMASLADLKLKDEIREANETKRKNSEKERERMEDVRVQAETLRTGAEALRADAETLRAQGEKARADAENVRAADESIRNNFELERQANENERKKNEVERQKVLGDVETALDAILAIQRALIGGE